MAISINVKEILSYRWLPARAAGTIAILVTFMVAVLNAWVLLVEILR